MKSNPTWYGVLRWAMQTNTNACLNLVMKGSYAKVAHLHYSLHMWHEIEVQKSAKGGLLPRERRSLCNTTGCWKKQNKKIEEFLVCCCKMCPSHALRLKTNWRYGDKTWETKTWDNWQHGQMCEDGQLSNTSEDDDEDMEQNELQIMKKHLY